MARPAAAIPVRVREAGARRLLHHQARTKCFDALWVDALAAGARQFVLLGAGFDTRGYRFADRLGGARVFEVDHPLTSAEKQRRLRRVIGAPPDHMTYVPIDFVRQGLADRLASSGFDPTRRTFFLWEGVTPYLTADAVDATLALVARAAPGSSIAFDYIHRSTLIDPSADAKKQLDLARKQGEPYEFGVDPADLAPLLERHGLALDSNLGADALAARYLVGSNGDVWGRPPPFLGIAHARVKGDGRPLPNGSALQ